MNTRLIVLAVCVGNFLAPNLPAADAVSGPLSLNITNGVKSLSWPRPLIPALEVNTLSQGPSPDSMFEIFRDLINVEAGGYTWSTTNEWVSQFFGLTQSQMSSNALLTAGVLNRLAYGPTPDELERVTAIGPQAYIDEQLAMETFGGSYSDPLETLTSVTTNSGTGIPLQNWVTTTVTGLVSSSTLYMYLNDPGTVQLDDVQFRYSYVLTAVTNNGGVITSTVSTNLTDDLLVNGNFEQALNTGWTVSANHAASFIDSSVAASGASSLRMTADPAGTTQGSSIWQNMPAAPVTTRGTNQPGGIIYTNTISTVRAVLTFSYLPTDTSRSHEIRLSG
jgi:hypothetical protein